MLSNPGTIPYRRLTDPIVLPVGTASQRTQVQAGFIPKEATTFRVTNPNNFWVRLRGATGAGASSLTIGPEQGWLFPPGFSGVFTTQFPEYMATISVGANAGAGTLEISYGVGGGGESAFYESLAGVGAGSIATGQVAINANSAVQVVPARMSRRAVMISPTGNVTYYIGGPGVTAANGVCVRTGGVITLDVTAAVFAIAATGTATLSFAEMF